MSNETHTLLHELFGHQAWADAEHWRVIDGFGPAREDHALRTRLHHLHQVQRTFMWAVGDRLEPFTVTSPDSLATIDDLRAFARGSHAEMDRVLSQMTGDRLSDRVTMPWFDPPLVIAAGEVLLQTAMHSQWHRGQNSVRLRELGITPPTVDLIVWYAQGRPAPRW